MFVCASIVYLLLDSGHTTKALDTGCSTVKAIQNFIENFKIQQHCDVLRGLVPFAQFKKREKHPWRSVTFSKVSGERPAILRKVCF